MFFFNFILSNFSVRTLQYSKKNCPLKPGLQFFHVSHIREITLICCHSAVCICSVAAEKKTQFLVQLENFLALLILWQLYSLVFIFISGTWRFLALFSVFSCSWAAVFVYTASISLIRWLSKHWWGEDINSKWEKVGGALWARIAQNVKKPPLTVNVIDFEFFGFNVSIWVPWSVLGPKKS